MLSLDVCENGGGSLRRSKATFPPTASSGSYVKYSVDLDWIFLFKKTHANAINTKSAITAIGIPIAKPNLAPLELLPGGMVSATVIEVCALRESVDVEVEATSEPAESKIDSLSVGTTDLNVDNRVVSSLVLTGLKVVVLIVVSKVMVVSESVDSVRVGVEPRETVATTT